MFEYQKYNHYFASVAESLESLCEQELQQLGAKNTRTIFRGVHFVADKATLYRINYQSRLATRIQAPLLTFSCHSTKYLQKTAATIAWEKFLSLDKTFSITASVSNSKITHSLYAAQCLKDAIADYFTIRYGKRPNVDTDEPDVNFNLHIERNTAVIGLNTSGKPLHKRGYRQNRVTAPMQETLAAALVRLSDWDGDRPFWDCMCGSGTIICEALMHYCRIPAQYFRTQFGFFHMPDFDKNIWESVRKEALDTMRPVPYGLIRGSDKSGKTVEIAKKNLEHLPYSEAIELKTTQFQDSGGIENGIIVTNPPYGKRIGTTEETKILYKTLGDFLKKKCLGTSAYILVGDPSLRKAIGLKSSRKFPLVNGSIPCVLHRIDSFRIPFRDGPKNVSNEKPK